MTRPGRRHLVSQHNHGSGLFVGGNVNGNIEIVDEKTRNAIVGISETAPQVAVLLAKALGDGLISPETARTLAGAARNINEDTAHLIWEGGRNINEDTAHWIWEGGRNINEDTAHRIWEAGRNINEDVASSLSRTAIELGGLAGRFEDVLGRIGSASSTLRSSEANAAEWERVATAMENAAQELAMASQVHAETRGQSPWNWFRNGTIMGFLLAISLAVLVLVIQTEVQ